MAITWLPICYYNFLNLSHQMLVFIKTSLSVFQEQIIFMILQWEQMTFLKRVISKYQIFKSKFVFGPFTVYNQRKNIRLTNNITNVK